MPSEQYAVVTIKEELTHSVVHVYGYPSLEEANEAKHLINADQIPGLEVYVKPIIYVSKLNASIDAAQKRGEENGDVH